MRKLLLLVMVVLFTHAANAQDPAPPKAATIINRSGDHFMIQIAQNSLQGAPDSISNRINKFNRSANVYLMLNKAFKKNKRLSIGLGVGVGTSNIYFKKTIVDISSSAPQLKFINADSINNYKKYKLSTTYAEVPLELRFTSNPDLPQKAIKAAIGVKVGTLLNAHTKGKNLQGPTGNLISSAVEKSTSKSYFNTTRIVATARVGYGLFSLFGAYNLTPMFKNGVAADIKLLQIGLTISGL